MKSNKNKCTVMQQLGHLFVAVSFICEMFRGFSVTAECVACLFS